MNDTLARAWALIARNPDLARTLPEIAADLEARYGLLGLAIDRLDTRRHRWETLAATGRAPSAPASAPPGVAERLARQPAPLFSPALLRLEDKTRCDGPAETTETLAGRLPTETADPWLARLILPAEASAAFCAVADDWLDLFGVAVANHHREAELRTRRRNDDSDRRALGKHDPHRENSAPIIGEDNGLRPVFDRVSVAARSDMSILLLGATGSGKEVVARAVHERSNRAGAAFIRVNCGAIPPELIDSELFGHEKGAFTGAMAARRGWFERADGGTLFLDEVAELSAAAQIRLLRVLQEKRFTRVGGEREIAVDVRVIAATHRDLEQRVANERFREDLWYRLAVFPIPIPALRQRPEDLAALTHYFIERAAARLGLPPVAATPAQLRRLEEYPWPGNVRELISVIERAVVLGQGRTLDLDTALGPAGARPVTSAAEPRDRPTPSSDRLDNIIAEHIGRILAETEGRIAGPQGAARRLGLHPNTLRSRMARLGLMPKTASRHETS